MFAQVESLQNLSLNTLKNATTSALDERLVCIPTIICYPIAYETFRSACFQQ